MKKRWKNYFALLLCICLAFSFTGCRLARDFKEGFDSAYNEESSENDGKPSGEDIQSLGKGQKGDDSESADSGTSADKGWSDSFMQSVSPFKKEVDPDSWLIYWYLCGSDLETEHGFATDDLFELFDVELPENIQVVIETGGAAGWQNGFVDGDAICRYLYSGSDLYLLDKQSSSSMGDGGTLYDFLKFVDDNYDAAHKALIFWDHGGGSLSGAAFDEKYDYDSIKLFELGSVLEDRYGKTSTTEDPQFDVIGFDACHMSTIDVAKIIKDYTAYLVASEESEPGNGWYYTGIFRRLSADPSMDGAAFGRCICDSFYEGCQMVGTESMATLSVTDMSKMPALLEAYDAYGDECLVRAIQDPGFVAQFYRSANVSENYGGNKEEEGYTDMVDLGSLAMNTRDCTSSSGRLISAINDAVIYKVQGKLRPDATGLSGYFSYDQDPDRFTRYIDVGASLSVKYLFLYVLGGEVTPGMEEYINGIDISLKEPAPPKTVFDTEWAGMPFTLDQNAGTYGDVYVDLGPEAKDIIADYWPLFVYLDVEGGYNLYLGENRNFMHCDWDTGRFTESFWGSWGSMDGYPVYMISMFSNEDYYVYAVPIRLNGSECHLQVAYSIADDRYEILGVCDGIDESGMARKGYRKIVPGDRIDIIWTRSSLDTYEEENVVVHSFTADEDLEFTDMMLPDGTYGMALSLWDTYGYNCMTNIVMYEMEDGLMRTTIAE